MLKGYKLLVTGGAGFIGSNLCDALLDSGNEVVCLDNFSTGKRANLQEASRHPNFTLIEGDIRNYEDCKKAVEGCNYVFHQAALGSVPRSINDPATSTDVNIGGFVKMLQASKEAGVKRFIYASSSSVYGDSEELPKVEHRIGKQLSPYALTKYADELFAHNFSALYGIETVGLRYFNVFGPRQDPSGAYAAVIPRFFSSFLKHQSPVVNGDGTYSRDFTYIKNVIQANELAAVTPTEVIRENLDSYYQRDKNTSSDGLLSEIFNVANGERISISELKEMIKEILTPYDSLITDVDSIFGAARPGDIPHSLASIKKSGIILGYSPKYSVRQGIEATCRWYLENCK